MLDTHRLRLLSEFARRGSIAATAAALGYTPSAVSQQLTALEREAGAVLLDRTARSAELTDAGRRLADHARRILAVHREALAAFDRDALAGEVTIGAPDDYASTFLPRILARFGRTHPRVQVNVVCRPSCELLPCLARGSVDLIAHPRPWGY